MIVRLRSRDGLERVTLPEGATVADLHAALHAQLNIPEGDALAVSKDAALLTSPSPESFRDLTDPAAALTALGVDHGSMLFLRTGGARTVAPAVKKGPLDGRPYGPHATLDSVIGQWVRIERQDKAEVGSVSFDRHAANAFQSYVQSALGFNISRGGLLYGTVDEEHNVRVEFVYEPPQEGGEKLVLQRHTPEEAQVDLLMDLLGLKKVGWVFSQPAKPRDYIFSAQEVRDMAAVQAELGPLCVTVVVSWEDNDSGGHVHFEAFQATRQCVELWRTGWLLPDAPDTPPSVIAVRNPKAPDIKEPLIVAGKDAGTVDCDWFLCPVKILDHDGPLLATFPPENRLVPQTKADLREQLSRHAALPYAKRLADGHLLLWLAKQPHLEMADVVAIVGAAAGGKPLLEGYRVILDSLAGV